MKKRIIEVARFTSDYLDKCSCNEERKIIENAIDELKKSVEGLKELDWNVLFAIKEEHRAELTTRQQAVIESYAKLKHVLLEAHRDIFKAIKDHL